METKGISIVTATFNRAYILEELYKSLMKQTCKKFEWIIVDDGSSDDTKDLVSNWISDGKIEISYLYQKNGGKHRALNFGVPHSKYDYVYIVDSDDYLVETAVAKILTWIEEIKGQNNFAGVSGLPGKNKKDKIGTFPKGKDYIDSTNIDRRNNYLTGDKAEIYKKNILLKYPFPEFENEKFLSEAAVWNQIAADGYLIRWHNEIIQVTNYLEDGLSKNLNFSTFLENFKGFTYLSKLNSKVLNFPENIYSRGFYTYVAKKYGISFKQISYNLECNMCKVTCSYLLYRTFDIFRKIKYTE